MARSSMSFGSSARTRWVRAGGASALLVTLLVAGSSPVAAERGPAPGGGVVTSVGIDPTDEAAVAAAWSTITAAPPASGWTGNKDTCTAGTTSQAYRNAELATVNAMRSLSGVAPVAEDTTWSAQAQQAALMMAAQGELSHFPDASWACFTQEGADAAGQSNLFLGVMGPAAQVGYVQDPGGSNDFVGHRRWILCPTSTKLGFGDVPTANATKVFGGGATAWSARDGFVAWPNPGLVPAALADARGLLDRFSLQVQSGHSVGGATVSITSSNGVPVTIEDLVLDNVSYCSPAVVWAPSRKPAAGEDWTITVTGLSAPGTGTYDKQWVVNFSDLDPTAPSAPTNVSATGGNGQATVSWTASVTHGAAITGYTVVPYVGAVAQTARVFDGTATSQVVTGLTNGTDYTFKVFARTASGQSPLSTASAPVRVAAPPGAPTGVSGVASGTDQITVSWSAPASGGSPITGYRVTPFVGSTAGTVRVFSSTATSQAITGLTRGTSYTFKVAAVNAKGIGTVSAASAAVVAEGPPGEPTSPTATAGNASATVGWTAPASTGGTPITGYVITPYIGAAAQTAVASSGTGTTKLVTGLANGTAYTFKVAAVNARGTGPQSTATSAVTPTAAPTTPGSPSGVTAVAGDAKATVSWTAPTSTGGSAITSYVITPYKAGVAQPTVASAGTGTSKLVTGLANGSSYTFKVAAVNGVGTGHQSGLSNAVVPKAAYAPFASWSELVKRLHVDLTDAQPSASALSSWVASLSGGSKTRGDLEEALRRTTDNTSNVDPVARLYRAFLGRTPDAGGLKFWVNRKRSGTWSLTKMADNFAASNEFKTKYGTLTNRQFVTRIYTDVLGRAADPSGVDYWTGRLDSGTWSRGRVMVGFSESNEYKRKQAENTDAAVAYVFLLGRAPTAAELTDWTTRRKAGTTNAALANELLLSSKYATHITG
jgi:uncharacterized protein YkwD